jgi:ABC-2 type transport system ATP-binding protein
LAELDQYSTHMLALNQGRVLEHRALHATTTVSRKIRMEFSHGDPLEIVFSGNLAEQADLLATYVAQGERTGQRLVSFYPVNENLQNSYLESLRAQRARSTS